MRHFKPQREHYIPQGAVKVIDKTSDAVAYIYTDKRDRPCAIAFHGRAQKPDWAHWFRSEKDREAKVRGHFEGRQARARFQAEQRAAASKPHRLEVGHVFVRSWGYDQTNVNFYQVTRVIGRHTVEVREICKNMTEETGNMSGRAVPTVDAFKGEPMVKRVSRGRISLGNRDSAGLWDGKPCYVSWYH